MEAILTVLFIYVLYTRGSIHIECFGGDEKANEYLLSRHDRRRVKWLLETLFTNISLVLQFDIIFLLEVPGEDQKMERNV